MSLRGRIVEKELQVKVPPQYDAFLEQYGIYDVGSFEVYGIRDDLLNYDGIPCVIGATRIYRQDEGLPHRFLLIYHTGTEDEIVCLDTEDEKVYAFSRMLGDRKVADSFDEWFQRDIIEYSKELEEYSEQLDKEWE